MNTKVVQLHERATTVAMEPAGVVLSSRDPPNGALNDRAVPNQLHQQDPAPSVGRRLQRCRSFTGSRGAHTRRVSALLCRRRHADVGVDHCVAPQRPTLATPQPCLLWPPPTQRTKTPQIRSLRPLRSARNQLPEAGNRHGEDWNICTATEHVSGNGRSVTLSVRYWGVGERAALGRACAPYLARSLPRCVTGLSDCAEQVVAGRLAAPASL